MPKRNANSLACRVWDDILKRKYGWKFKAGKIEDWILYNPAYPTKLTPVGGVGGQKNKKYSGVEGRDFFNGYSAIAKKLLSYGITESKSDDEWMVGGERIANESAAAFEKEIAAFNKLAVGGGNIDGDAADEDVVHLNEDEDIEDS